MREYQQVSWHFFMEYTIKFARKVSKIDRKLFYIPLAVYKRILNIYEIPYIYGL